MSEVAEEVVVEEEPQVEVEEEVQIEEEEQEPVIMTMDDVRIVEAVLFASPEPISTKIMEERMPEGRGSVISEALENLKEHYADRGINLVKRGNKWAFRTSQDLADSIEIEKERVRKFTKAAMETMAIIAYHQPVTRAEIENIRGVSTSPGSLDALMEAGWIKLGKRREVPGRPVTWMSTQQFLDHFGLESLRDLPGMEELKESGLLDKRPAIEAMPTTVDMFDGDINEGKEGDDPQEVTDEDLIGTTENDEVDSLPVEDDKELEV